MCFVVCVCLLSLEKKERKKEKSNGGSGPRYVAFGLVDVSVVPPPPLLLLLLLAGDAGCFYEPSMDNCVDV